MFRTKMHLTLALAAVFAFVALLIPETSGVSFPVHHQDLLPIGRRLRRSLKFTSEQLHPHPSGKHGKKRRVLKVSKGVFNKLLKEQEHQDELSELPEEVPKADYALPSYKQELIGNDILYAPVSSSKTPQKEKVKPYYDCPMFVNENELDGKSAIIKPDPFDCSSYYYCNWGIHYVITCPWPLLFNYEIIACDWFWRVQCQTWGS